jgi:hypothetical protein
VKLAATIGAVILCFACSSSYGQDQAERKPHVAPPELTILKHNLGSERRFVNEAMPQSPRGGEPPTRLVSQLVMTVSVKVRSNATKAIVGVSWYFVLTKNSSEDYFSLPFITPTDIPPRGSKTFKVEIERLPGRSRAVTVDELKHPDKGPGRERIVITCVVFSDGTSSPLNGASKRDCRQLEAAPEIRRKIKNSSAELLLK